jgi:hypothetical protein
MRMWVGVMLLGGCIDFNGDYKEELPRANGSFCDRPSLWCQSGATSCMCTRGAMWSCNGPDLSVERDLSQSD